jgi:alkylhydroperoxidase/carboxymuconolactone decarboxylase family protein YurZ
VEQAQNPLGNQRTVVSNTGRLAEVSPDLATAFRALRAAADSHSTLDAKQRELCLVAGFAAGHNEVGFRAHCVRAVEAGATVPEVEQVVLLMLGTSLGLAPVVETLRWLHDELL